MKRRFYTVAGSNGLQRGFAVRKGKCYGNAFRPNTAVSYNHRGWFARIPAGQDWWSSYTAVDCRTLAHALAQYRRLKVGHRQIDYRAPGIRKVFRYD